MKASFMYNIYSGSTSADSITPVTIVRRCIVFIVYSIRQITEINKDNNKYTAKLSKYK
jgi:hypothetical protein